MYFFKIVCKDLFKMSLFIHHDKKVFSLFSRRGDKSDYKCKDEASTSIRICFTGVCFDGFQVYFHSS